MGKIFKILIFIISTSVIIFGTIYYINKKFGGYDFLNFGKDKTEERINSVKDKIQKEMEKIENKKVEKEMEEFNKKIHKPTLPSNTDIEINF